MIFKDDKLNEQLENHGYVVLPFLSKEEVASVRDIYTRYQSESPYFHSTTFFDDLEQKKQLSAEVKAVFNKHVSDNFENYKEMGASFLTKPPGQGGFMPVHQDWTIVDESKFGSYTIWIPLQDVDDSNGAITVLDGSHKFTDTLRAPTLPVVIKDIEPSIRQQMKTLRMKAGEAFIFNHALIHASHNNSSTENRLAVTYGLLPEEASLVFYHMNEGKKVEKYDVDDDFFMRYVNIGQRPEFAKPSKIFDLDFSQISEKSFQDFTNSYKKKTMKKLFKDESLQAQYEKDGYVLVDLLSEEEVKELKDFYSTLNNDHIPFHGFHVSLDNSNSDFIGGVMHKIKSVITRHAEELFTDYKIFTSSYVVKEKNPIGVVPPHQDWSFTEEDQGYNSATVWTALVDTNMINGAMGVLVGSHNFFNHHRASPAPQFKTPLDTHVFSIFPYLKLVPMKPGQALIFDNRTIHASPPNISDSVRLAVGFGVTQADAPLRHFYMVPGTDNKKLEKYAVDDYFFTNYNNGKLSDLYNQGKKPEGLTYLETVENRVQDISADELVAKIKAAGNEFNVEMVEHLAKLFNYNPDGTPKNAEPEASPKQEEKPVEQSTYEPQQTQWVDDRPFFKKYTPLNIIREIKDRVLA